MKQSIIKNKSYIFSIKIIKFYKFIVAREKEYIIGRQILKSGTSIGANVEEALGAQSKKDFLSKLSIAYKEARETHYWLRLLKGSLLRNYSQVDILLSDCNELLKILSSMKL